jgi:hypothetical protein
MASTDQIIQDAKESQGLDFFTNKDYKGFDGLVDVFNFVTNSENLGLTGTIGGALAVVLLFKGLPFVLLASIGFTTLTVGSRFLGELGFVDFVANNEYTSEFLNNPSLTFGRALNGLVGFIGENNLVGQTLRFVGETIQEALFYKDGVTETRYGLAMERSWTGSSNSFLGRLSEGKIIMDNYEIRFSNSTPLDPSSENSNTSLYGNLLLGAPPVFTHVTDPNNRTIINTFVKDSLFLSLTPGLPKFNGGSFTQGLRSSVSSGFKNIVSGNPLNKVTTNTYLNQTETPDEMLSYLLKNGIDPDFADKDKRYYTFQAKYSEYYSYLETMLNAIWIKLGLGTEGNNKFNLFSFFDTNNATTNYDETLKSKYRSSLGFYVSAAVSESVNNVEYSAGLEDDANEASVSFQRINFITGMGTDKVGAFKRIAGVAETGLSIMKAQLNDLSGGESGLAGIFNAVRNLSTTQDLSSVVQAFSVTNGMKVMYPNLWADSSYSKNVNFNFNFVSPYGDPLSIFQYVYVPFFSLLAFVLPRQAAENGYVSPLFVRADVPGLITSDLALITDLTWIKGGDNNLWTKDKLPRAISGSFTVTDLFPYLSMVKRLSFLSANPSFTVFLDNMSGLRALYNNVRENPLNVYWQQMINRVSGEGNSQLNGELWNRYGENKTTENSLYMNREKSRVARNLNAKAIPWMSNIG